MLVPHPVPPGLLPPSAQVCAPLAHEVVPFLQPLGLPVHPWFAVHDTQLPAPSHTRLLPQPVPAALLVSSAQLWDPVAHEVVPFLQMLGLPVHPWFAVHATHAPAPL